MKHIELKINPIVWFASFVFFFAFSTGLIFFSIDYPNLLVLFSASFFASLIVVGAMIGIFYFYQKEVILTDNEIKKVGFPSKSIAYSNIQKIKVGTGGFSIYDKSGSPINITTIYSNFNDAKKLLKQKLGNLHKIEISGSKYFIDKYIGN